jgi:hypothetical protein
MLPIRHRSIFLSRYTALLWAAGIIWFAYDVAGGSAPESNGNNQQTVATDITGAPVTQQDIDTLKSVMNTM